MKKQIDLKNVKGILSKAKTQGWALCVGAGISMGVFPSWIELAQKVYNSIEKTEIETSFINDFFSLDAMLQAGFELSNKSDEEYVEDLSKLLFEKASEIMDAREFSIFSKVLSSEILHKIDIESWKSFIEIREKYIKDTSSYQIAQVVADICDSELKPDYILSFNAEIMLFQLINSFILERFSNSKGICLNNSKKYIDIVNRSVSNAYKERIKYVLCHGVLPVSGEKNDILSATDKLVFLESEYLNLSNISFSWQASSFLNVISTKSVVFIGVSLSDSNMRKWLNWVHTNRVKEVQHVNKKITPSTTHFWINKKLESEEKMKWIEAGVYHLGVRIIWIDDWKDVGKCIRLMIGYS